MQGRCECGSVRFEVTVSRTTVTFCHCSQCRRTSGHLWGSVKADYADLRWISTEGLTWFTSSDVARRGFCATCGSSLFYRMNDEAGIGISAGAFDAPTGFTPGKHIFTAHKGDYYDIADGVPQIETY